MPNRKKQESENAGHQGTHHRCQRAGSKSEPLADIVACQVCTRAAVLPRWRYLFNCL